VPQRDGVPGVNAADVPADAHLLDVREDAEWAAGHPPGAHHLPMMQIPARLAEVPTEGDLVVVCRVGARSAQVVAYLRAAGWDDVRNLEGGLMAWERAGRPLVSEDGRAPEVA
jgi:rhodanese-related sulfurtransferase